MANSFSFSPDDDPTLTSDPTTQPLGGGMGRKRKRKGGGGKRRRRHQDNQAVGQGAGAPGPGGNDGAGSQSLGNKGSGGPFDSGIPGNITSGQGAFAASEHPEDYWAWLMSKSGLNQNKQTPFGSWVWGQYDLMNQLFGASKLDNPNNQFPNFLGGLLGVGSPTPPNPGGPSLEDPDGDGKPGTTTPEEQQAQQQKRRQRRRRHDQHDDKKHDDKHGKKGKH